MAQNNIYDFYISELLRGLSSAVQSIDLTTLSLSTNQDSLYMIEGQTVNGVTFTSDILNLPAGWTVVADSHVLTVTGFSDTVGSTDPLTTPNYSINLPFEGDTLAVSSTVDVTDGTETVTLNALLFLTAVNSFYSGVKSYSATPTSSSLSESKHIENNSSFVIEAGTVVGRLIFALPNTASQPISIVDQHGNEWLINDFEQYNDGSYLFYQSLWDTQFVGNEDRTFTLKYA